MIRNKRLLKEKERINDECIEWPDDLNKDVVTIKIRNNVILNIYELYPFKCPKMYINNIDHIEWFLKQKHKYKNLVDKMNIKINCICCKTITCDWTPTFGLIHMIEEYDTYNNDYSTLKKFSIIYQKIIRFDNLIYQKIINFLYISNI